jgi:hypothetical protein
VQNPNIAVWWKQSTLFATKKTEVVVEESKTAVNKNNCVIQRMFVVGKQRQPGYHL